MTLEKLIQKEAFIIIIRAIHTRGEDQQIALQALKARGLWLSQDQKLQAGLAV